MPVQLPPLPASIEDEHPDVWKAYAALGKAVSAAGPLDERTRRLIHLALAIGSDSEGAVHSHVRRGLADGLTPDELEHVGLLAATTMGWPHAVRALSWIRDVTRPNAAT